MRENIVPAQHYPFPLRNKAYTDQLWWKWPLKLTITWFLSWGFVLINIPMERYGIGKVRNQNTSETKSVNSTYMANMVISTKLSSVSNMPNMPYMPSLTDKSKLSNKTNISMLFAIINSTNKTNISIMTISPIWKIRLIWPICLIWPLSPFLPILPIYLYWPICLYSPTEPIPLV